MPFEAATLIPAEDSSAELPWPVRQSTQAPHQLRLVPDRERRAFTDAERVQVWLKGVAASNLNIAYWRFDMDGNLMSWTDYDNIESPYGWEIDHIVPLEAGGTNALANLRPLHISRNRSLAGIFGEFSYSISE